MSALKDLKKDQYQKFIIQSATVGVSWICTFQLKAPSIHGLFPELGPYILLKNSLNLFDKLSIRKILEQSFPFYIDDLVEYKISSKDKTLTQGISSFKNISIFSAQQDDWKLKYGKVKVEVKLLEKGPSRIEHEEKSLIANTEDYLKKIDVNKNLLELKDKLIEPLRTERVKIDFSNVIYTKVDSYLRLLDFYSLSKYSNEFLLDLDNFLFDDQEAQKMIDRLYTREDL